MNKGESHNCIEKAEQHIKEKQFEIAEKYILKSKRLFSLPKADELLKKLKEIQQTNQKDYTEEQENLVKKVKNSQNFYEMLDIKTTATVSEIKKAYKKLALLLHPDKNTAPGSGDLFVVVSNAVETLCDYPKRKTYDRTLMKPFSSAYHSERQTHPSYYDRDFRTFGYHPYNYISPFEFYRHHAYNQNSLPTDSEDYYGYYYLKNDNSYVYCPEDYFNAYY